MAKRILAPISVAERGEAIVPIVSALAQGAGSTVRLLRVFPVPGHVVDSDGRTVAYSDQEMARLTSEGEDDLARVETQLAGVPVESVVRFGEAVEEILLEAEAFDADLIALGATRRGRLSSTLAPGVAEQVARKSAVPTLTFTRLRSA